MITDIELTGFLLNDDRLRKKREETHRIHSEFLPDAK